MQTEKSPTQCPCGSTADLIDFKHSEDNQMQCIDCNSLVILEEDGTIKRIDIVTGKERK